MEEVYQEINHREGLSSSLRDRMVRAAKLDNSFYDEIRSDNTATMQALAVVLATSMSTGIGYGVSIVIQDGFAWLSWGLALGIVLAVATWILWSSIVYLLGRKLFRSIPANTTYKGMLRSTGFANSPGAIGIFLFLPFLSFLVFAASGAWAVAASVVAVRRALDSSTLGAIGVCFLAWVIFVLIIVTPFLTLVTIAKVS